MRSPTEQMRVFLLIAALVTVGACAHAPSSPDDHRSEPAAPTCPRKLTEEEAKSLAAVAVGLSGLAAALNSLAQIKWH